MIKIYSAKITDFTQADYTKQYSLLDCALREKIDAKTRAEDKMQSLAGWILLYRGAYELYGKSVFDINFNENGKPLCGFCFFNISHSGDRVVCAFADTPIGIDIQKINPVKQREKYKFFNAKENIYVNSDVALVSRRYTEIFTKKEAAVKMLGLTLAYSRSIDTFSNEFCFEMHFDGELIITACIQNKEIV